MALGTGMIPFQRLNQWRHHGVNMSIMNIVFDETVLDPLQHVPDEDRKYTG
jgi:hypothetical protein